MLKVVSVCLHTGENTLATHAVLDDGADRSILLPQAVQCLGLTTQPGTISLCTVRQDIVQISRINQPNERHVINGASAAENLGPSEHTYPVKQLHEQYHHLRGIPLQSVDHALCPSHHSHRANTHGPGGPLAVHTRLGWALQGPASLI